MDHYVFAWRWLQRKERNRHSHFRWLWSNLPRHALSMAKVIGYLETVKWVQWYLMKWVKVFKNGAGKTCGRQPLKNLNWYGRPFINFQRPSSANFTWSILEYFPSNDSDLEARFGIFTLSCEGLFPSFVFVLFPANHISGLRTLLTSVSPEVTSGSCRFLLADSHKKDFEIPMLLWMW